MAFSDDIGQFSIEHRVAHRIKAYRWQRLWSQEVFARELGVTQAFISRLEHGKQNLSLRKLEQVADAMMIDVAELVASVEETPGSEDLYRRIDPRFVVFLRRWRRAATKLHRHN